MQYKPVFLASLSVFLLLAGCGESSGSSASPDAGALTSAAGGNVELVRDDAVGTKYAAPGPRRCTPPNLADVLTAASARAYVICSGEGEHNDYLYLLANVQVSQVTARAYDGATDARDDVDPAKPVYDIAGSVTSYQCQSPGGYRNVPPAEACKREAMPNARGICYQEHSGNWQCTFLDPAATPVGAPVSAPPNADE